MHLTPQERKAFRVAGYLVKRQVFFPEEVREMRMAASRLESLALSLAGPTREGTGVDVGTSRFVLARENGRVQIHRVLWCGGLEPCLLRYGRSPRVTRVVSDLLGSDSADHLLNQLHPKLPGDGVSYEWHTDAEHRRMGRLFHDADGHGSYVQVVTAIDPHTRENGPLQFAPGSHLVGGISPGTDPQWFARPESVLAEPGDVIFFGPYVWHRSAPNTSPVPRMTLINGYALPGVNTRVYPGVGTGVRVDLLTGDPVGC